MNLNGDEKRIRQLFREMSRDDQRRAPQFAVTLAAANCGIARSQKHAWSLRFVMAAAILCAVLLIATAIIVSPSKSQRGATPDDQASTPSVQREAPAPQCHPAGTRERRVLRRASRPRNAVAERLTKRRLL
jgi:hypothetical protein